MMKQHFLTIALLLSFMVAPLSGWANCQRADTLVKQAQGQKSDLLEQAIQLCSDHREAHYQLAQVQAKAGQWGEAQKLYQRVIDIDPDFAPAYAELGEVLMKRQDYEQAALMFDQFLTLADTNPALQSQIGKYEAKLKEAQTGILENFNSDKMFADLSIPRGVGSASYSAQVRFESNSHQIKEKSPSWQQCQKMAVQIQRILGLKGFENSKIRIEGHTDSIGSARYNERLSALRANSVKKVLTNDFNISAKHLYAIGMGEAHPISSNKTRHGRFLNRRVNLVRIDW